LQNIGHIKGNGESLQKGVYDEAEVWWSKLVYLFKEYLRYPPQSEYDKIQLESTNWLTKAIIKHLPRLRDFLILYER